MDVEANERAELIDQINNAKKRKTLEIDQAKKSLEAQKEALMSQMATNIKKVDREKALSETKNKIT